MMRMMTMSGMTREEAIKMITNLPVYRAELIYGGNSDLAKALGMAIADMEKQIQWEKTERFNRMIEAFECDFALIEQGEKTFAELDGLLKDKRHFIAPDMALMQELSYLLRHGKAEIRVMSEERG